MTRFQLPRALASTLLVCLLSFANGASAHAQGRLSPDASTEAQARLHMRCHMSLTCPLGAKDYTLFERAWAGDHEAEYEFAQKLAHGQGMAADREGAALWYGRAAEGGNVRAAVALNQLYAEGVSVHADDQKIAQALRSAANRGSVDAAHALSAMNADGRTSSSGLR